MKMLSVIIHVHNMFDTIFKLICYSFETGFFPDFLKVNRVILK